MGKHAEMSNVFGCEHLFSPYRAVCMCQAVVLTHAVSDFLFYFCCLAL